MVHMGEFKFTATGVKGDAEGFVETDSAQPPVGVTVLVRRPSLPLDRHMTNGEYRLKIAASTQLPPGSKWRIWGE